MYYFNEKVYLRKREKCSARRYNALIYREMMAEKFFYSGNVIFEARPKQQRGRT